MANLDTDQLKQVKVLIYQTYQIDVESIKNLAQIATKLQNEKGLIVPCDLSVRGSFNLLPKGTIVIWNGTDTPTGWALCDGSIINGTRTPDMSGRFILGMDTRGGKDAKVDTVPFFQTFP